MKTRNRISMIFCVAALLSFMVGGASIGFSHDLGAPVGPVTGNITSLNYNEDGTVNGFVVDNTILLSFSKVCGEVASLGVSGNVVTYSGTLRTNPDHPISSIVSVTTFTNITTSVAYTRSTWTTIAYTSTAGSVGAPNYDSNGDVNGFFWTSAAPVAGSVLVITGAEALKRLALTPSLVTSVTGSTRTNSCGATSPIIVKASALNNMAIRSKDRH